MNAKILSKGFEKMKVKEEISFNSNVSSSKQPLIHLIPTIALVRTADNFELGKLLKKEKAWNATSSNQDCLSDKEFLLDRCSHIIKHTLKMRDKIVNETMDLGEDDAAGVVFGGMLLICASHVVGFQKDERFEKFDK